jgi:Tol biopolymer transport system component
MRQKRYFIRLIFGETILFAAMLSGCNQTSVANIQPTIPLTPIATFTPAPMPTPTLHLPQFRKIVFYSEREYHKTYIVDADGSSLAQMFEAYPVIWSPNGQYIVFTSNHALYVMDIKTKTKTPITVPDHNIISRSVWSPDSKKLAMRSLTGDGQGKVYIADIEKIQQGIQGESITLIREGVDAYELAWSPDSNYLTLSYQVEMHESYQVMVLNVSTKEIALAFNGMGQMWSPDGKQIVFVSVLNGGANIFLIKNVAEAMERFKSGKVVNYQHLTTLNTYNKSPVWSPDGKKIVFASGRDGNWEIYVMNADGSNQTRLTNHPDVDMQPAWSYDGKQIAFVSTRDGNQEIYVINADGSNLLRLTNNDTTDSDPVWMP